MRMLVAKSALDAEQQRTIQLRQQAEDLQGRLNSYASRRRSISARIARAEQEVQNRRTILGRTEVTLPFDARIGAVSIDQNEFVAVGSMLLARRWASWLELMIHNRHRPDSGDQALQGTGYG
jgi:multidrug efflux pump subunit AcrA (membrane-fusion protein)